MTCRRLPERGESVDGYEYAESHGGKAANQAVAVARLGGKVHLITRLGRDRHGQEALDLLKREGVNLRYVTRDDCPTGVSFIILDADGQQFITTHAGSSGKLTADDVKGAEPALRQASAILLQGEIEAEASMAAAGCAGERTCVILNPSPLETFAGLESWSWVDLLILNEPEGRNLLNGRAPTAGRVATSLGIDSVVLTLGAEGAEVFYGGRSMRVPAEQADVVDTTGAGDVFCAALAVALERGRTMEAAARWACRCASFSVGRKYCIPSIPRESDVPEGSPIS